MYTDLSGALLRRIDELEQRLARVESGFTTSLTAADKNKLDSYPTVSGLTTEQPLRATGSATVAFGPLNLANVNTTTGALPINRGGSGVAMRPAFRAHRTQNQSGIASGVWTRVQMNVEDYDTDNQYDSTTNYRFQPVIAGYYWFAVTIRIDLVGTPLSSTAVIAGIRKNGNEYIQSGGFANQTGVFMEPTVVDLVPLNGSTDYVDAWVYQNSGSNQSVLGLPWTCAFRGSFNRPL